MNDIQQTVFLKNNVYFIGLDPCTPAFTTNRYFLWERTYYTSQTPAVWIIFAGCVLWISNKTERSDPSPIHGRLLRFMFDFWVMTRVTKVLIPLALKMKTKFLLHVSNNSYHKWHYFQQGILEEFMVLISFQMHQSIWQGKGKLQMNNY
jgi:hypothetical protein